MSERPAPFIVGVPRSGTTLLRLMLDAHPDLAIPAETHFLGHVCGQSFISKSEFVKTVTGWETWNNMALDAAVFEECVDRLEPFSLSEAIRCFYRLYASRRGKARWGDKTGRYLARMTSLLETLPEAHFVHVIRDGRDNALSLRGLWFGPGDEFVDLARFWSGRIMAARKQAAAIRNYIEVRYEALVTEPERTLRTICDRIELPFDRAMLDYHTTATARLAEYRQPFGASARTPTDMDRFMSIHTRAAQPLETGRVGRWRSEMSAADRNSYEAVAGPLLRDLGYMT